MFFCRQKGKRLKQPTFKQLPVYRPHCQIPWTVGMGGRQKMNAAIGNLRHCLHIAWLCDLIDRNPLGIHGPYQHIDGLPLAAPGQHICVASYCKLWNPLPDRCNLSAFVTQSDPRHHATGSCCHSRAGQPEAGFYLLAALEATALPPTGIDGRFEWRRRKRCGCSE